MTEKYTSELLGVVIAQIAQTIGYNRTQSVPLELLEDILLRFIQELARDLHSQAEHANRIEPNLKDAVLSLKNVNINVPELLDYIGNVEPIPFVREIPAYPVKRNSNMNFLKPGSVETLTRPVHIFEYLPPMLPTEPTPTVSCSNSTSSIRWPEKSEHEHLQLCKLESNREFTTTKLIQDVKNHFPATATVVGGISKLSTQNSSSTDNLDHNGHAIREISSVVMTTGGFISPAIEGKLPEAYVPDIIEKFKGLDAPSIPHVPKLLEIQKDATNDAVDISKIKKLDSLELLPDIAMIDQKSPCDGPTISNEINKGNEEGSSAATGATAFATLAPNTKLKKSKKKNISTGQTTNDSSSVKAVDKARRKALKIFQKLSKNQIEGGSSGSNVIDLKKMKILNRGILSDLPDGSTERAQFEKLIKKQTKLRQKQIKYQKQQQLQEQPQQPLCQFQSTSKFSIDAMNTMPVNPFNSVNPEPLEQPVSEVGFLPPAAMHLEDKEAYNIATAPNLAIELIDEIKLANEPDRNKLNIFKKISKQKASKLNVSSNAYENANNVASPLINLPSGTTITPAPPAPSVNENITNTNSNLSLGNLTTYDYLDTYPQLPPAATNLPNNDLNKPKKRGRKPGGKNQCRPQGPSLTNMSSIPSSIQIQKKTKASKLNPVYTYQDGTTVMPTLSTAVPIPLTFHMPVMEPLNLSHVDQLKSNVNFADNQGENKVQKPKEKKERKKSKTKYQDSNIIDNTRELNKKICLMDSDMKMSKDSTLVIGAESDTKLVGSLSFASNSGPRTANNFSSSNNERNIMPMLPLLHFPPRPGLIPTGPGLFPPNLTGFNKSVACGTASNLIMPHSFMNFSATAPDNKANALSGVMPLSDIHVERSYCNVAPLVPDSMKLPTLPVEGVNLKSPHRMLSNELADAEVAHRSTVVQADNDDTTNTRKAQAKLLSAATGNVGDPIEVSDSDSNDGESKANNSLSPRHKSNIKQPSSLMNPGIGIEACQLYAINSNPLLQPQFNRQPHTETLKMRQTDENLLSVAPPPPQPTTATATATAAAAAEVGAAATKQTTAATTTPFKINFMGSDKFSLAGGADLIPLSRIDSGLAYSSLTVPSTSLALGATSGAPTTTSADAIAPTTAAAAEPHFLGTLGYDDLTITPTNSMTISELKIRKLHKKFKKPKEGKIKKKKDKKDKIRNKCKADDMDVLSSEKIKSEEKKLRKDKKRKKQLPTDRLQIMKENHEAGEGRGSSDMKQSKNITVGAVGLTVVGGDVDALAPSTVGHSIPMTPNLIASPKLDLSPNHVPKLTLKLSGRSTPSQPTVDGMDHEHNALVTNTTGHPPQTASTLTKREHSPELARFSPLVTRAPKPKQLILF
ncbi:uncharacterized protein LOC6585799 isoform X2 [Drosophila mojavensis]|uniref:uncharacterized protein LOC6585799 isoform X2 n=1 Tax=Drosophila mojavensis TaxID=7230 RepID=UPI0013EE7D71|nr:uncharacterized protein LOC6585799 isoform X2 [Drosophila mojavensis]